MSVDTSALLARVNLYDLIGRDTPLKRVATTAGGEWAGPCTFCGGSDRLRVQPDRGRWWCRQCSPDEHWSDAIDYVRQRDGLDFVAAAEQLGASLSEMCKSTRPAPPVRSEQPMPPPTEWRERTWQMVERWKETLWSAEGERALAWLRNRGLRDDWIASTYLGYQPEPDSSGLRRGITIPWFDGDVLWAVKVRRPVAPGARDKYWALPGSVLNGLYADHMIRAGEPVAICEAELDAILALQETEMPAVATSGVRSSLGVLALRQLILASRWLIAYDADTPGDSAATSLCESYARAIRWRPPEGKDVTEYHQLGGKLSDWLTLSGLEAVA